MLLVGDPLLLEGVCCWERSTVEGRGLLLLAAGGLLILAAGKCGVAARALLLLVGIFVAGGPLLQWESADAGCGGSVVAAGGTIVVVGVFCCRLSICC